MDTVRPLAKGVAHERGKRNDGGPVDRSVLHGRDRLHLAYLALPPGKASAASTPDRRSDSNAAAAALPWPWPVSAAAGRVGGISDHHPLAQNEDSTLSRSNRERRRKRRLDALAGRVEEAGLPALRVQDGPEAAPQFPNAPSVLITLLSGNNFNVKANFPGDQVPMFLADALAGMLRHKQQPPSAIWTPPASGGG